MVEDKEQRIETLQDRVDELEATVSKMLPSRRDALKLGAAGAVGAVGMAGSASAQNSNQVGTIGTDSERVDVNAEDIDEKDVENVVERLQRAKNWAREYAPKDYVYQINEEPEQDFSDEEIEALNLIETTLEEREFKDADDLDGELWNVQKESQLDAGEFFKTSYNALLGRDNGPRLSTLIMSIGQEKSRKILSKA